MVFAFRATKPWSHLIPKISTKIYWLPVLSHLWGSFGFQDPILNLMWESQAWDCMSNFHTIIETKLTSTPVEARLMFPVLIYERQFCEIKYYSLLFIFSPPS
jgi:hypothetical protein